MHRRLASWNYWLQVESELKSKTKYKLWIEVHRHTHYCIDNPAFQTPIGIPCKIRKKLAVEKILQQIYDHYFREFWNENAIKLNKLLITIALSGCLMSPIPYLWYFTAPRRFVILLMRVFVIRARVELLPRSEMLVRYFMDDAALSLASALVLATAESELCSSCR